MKKVKLTISGRVQGVGYRRWIFKKINAFEDSVFGYVRNLENGNVEILVLSNEKIIENIVVLAKKGPLFSKVDDVFLEVLENNELILDEFCIKF